ncbi:XRE family transcriptional regulator [Arthrobacter globiformis]|jgi:DNA-binding XRE family transcriptional regulator|uniref:XRE family transcriptional regulator n=2 Tax=Arthrobacter TaxID=1663 RepID=A0AAU8EKV1_9MICC|nr:XRE family transcriptional regulator [Arthrobacter globiformis]GAB14419.1 putative Xre family DNA-binding protein [Arthrobacter globiformis NBRC 12137]
MTDQAGEARDMAAENTEDGVAGKLERIIAGQVRHYRTANGLSASELASRTGMSKAMISKIETASTSCSLTTLQRLADGLKIPVTALFRGADTDRDATFTKNGQGSLTVRSGTQHGHEYRVLGTLKGRTDAIEPTLVTLTDASDVFPLFQHPGTEFIYMLAGRMVYGHGAYEYTMEPGDSLLLDGEGPHGPLELLDLPIRFLAIAAK